MENMGMGDKLRLFLTLVALGLIAAIGVGIWRYQDGRTPVAGAKEATAAIGKHDATVAGIDLPKSDPWYVQRARDMDARALLPMDSRFPAAIERVYELAGLPVPEILIQPAEAGWAISVDGEHFADVAEFVTFAEGFALVAVHGRIAREALFGADADEQLPALLREAPDWRAMSPTQAYDAVAEIDGRWEAEGPTMPLVAEAAGACVRAGAGIPNDLWLADPIHSQALALLALVATDNDPEAGALACDLAWTMGYASDAASIAKLLPSDDILRHRVLDLESESPDAETEFDSMRRLERLSIWNESEEWLAEGDRMLGKRAEWTLPVIATSRHLDGGDTGWTMLWLGAHLLIEHLESGAPIPAIADVNFQAIGGPPINVLPRFEYALANARPGGVLLDRRFVSAWHRAWFYEFIWVMPGKKLIPSAKAMLPRILGRPREPNGWMLLSWAHYATDSYPEAPQGVSMIVQGAAIAGKMRQQLAWEADDGVPETTAAYRDVQNRAVRAFEARPGYHYQYSWLAGSVLLDPGIEARWARDCLDLSEGSLQVDSHALDAAVFLDDWDAVRRLILDPGLEPWRRGSWCLWAGTQPGVPEGWAGVTFRKIVEAFGPSWATLQYAVDAMIVEGRGADAGDLLDSLPEGASPCDDCERNSRANLVLRSYVVDGQWDEALRVEVPPFEGDVDAFDAKVRVFLHANDLDAALAVAVGGVAKKPGNARCRARLAHVLWMRGENQRAAGVLLGPGIDISNASWREIVAPAFAEAFRDRPDEAGSAVTALAANGLDSWPLEYMAAGLEIAEEPRLALLLLPLVKPTRFHHEIELAMRQAACMRAIDGDAAAGEWLRGRIARHQGARVITVCIQLREFDFLWTDVPSWNEPDAVAYLWAARAISLASTDAPDPERRAMVETWVDDKSHTWESQVVRYFLGKYDDEQFLATAQDQHQECIFQYYIALRAHLEGEVGKAIRHYRLCADVKYEATAANNWAIIALRHIENLDKCPAWLDEHPEKTFTRGWWDSGVAPVEGAPAE